MSTAYKNKGPNAVQEPPVKDHWIRCDKCAGAGGYGVPNAGTLVITETIHLRNEAGGPNQAIGIVIRCGRPGCDKPAVVKMFKAGVDLEIAPVNIYRLIKACPGVPTFRLHELFSGHLDQPEMSPTMVAFLRPRVQFGEPVDNPDAHIEPKQTTEVTF